MVAEVLNLNLQRDSIDCHLSGHLLRQAYASQASQICSVLCQTRNYLLELTCDPIVTPKDKLASESVTPRLLGNPSDKLSDIKNKEIS